MMRIRLMIAALVLAVTIVLLQRQITAQRNEYVVKQPKVFVPPVPQLVRAASLGYYNSLADIYWMRIIQYREMCHEQKVAPKEIYHMADFLTDIDPKYCIAYFYSGMVMMDEVGDNQDMIALLSKGSNPEYCQGYWKNPFLLGYFYYFGLQDYESAAKWMDLTCKWHDGHALYCGLATRISSITGAPELGIQLLDEIFAQNEDPYKRYQLIERRAELEAKIVERDLTAAALAYTQKHGREPQVIDDIFSGGPVFGTPPEGYRAASYDSVPPHPLPAHIYLYDPVQQAVRSEPPINLGVIEKKKNNPEANP